MKNKFIAFLFLCALAIVVWVAIGAPGSDQTTSAKPAASGQGELLPAEVPPAKNTPDGDTASRTATLEPTPTIGYRSTANAAQFAASTAQANADAANRLLVQATAQHEANLQEQASWTAEASRQQLMFLEWTATARPSSIPATQTQMVVEQTKQAVIVTQLAMTIQAPTAIVMLAQARSQADFAPYYNLASVIGLFSISVFLMALSGWLFRILWKPAMGWEEKSAKRQSSMNHFGTVVSIKTEAAGYTSMKRMVIPCTPAMLTELAKGLMVEHKTLGVNQWEGAESSTWTRASYLPMRNFLLANQLAHSAGGGALVLTSEGESFFHAWLDEGSVPPPYEFNDRPNPFTANNAHMSDAHGENKPVGEGMGGQSMRPLVYQDEDEFHLGEPPQSAKNSRHEITR
jgi:hypothetical protein